MASLSVLLGILGKKSTALYLTAIAGVSVICGLVLDQVYALSAIDARAVVGQAAELFPPWAQTAGAVLLVALSAKPLAKSLNRRLSSVLSLHGRSAASDCGCGDSCDSAGRDHSEEDR